MPKAVVHPHTVSSLIHPCCNGYFRTCPPFIHSYPLAHSHPLVHSHSLIQSPTFIHSSTLIRSSTLIHSSTQTRRPVPVRVHGGVREARLGGDGGRGVGGGGQHPRLRPAGARRAVQVRAEWYPCTLHEG